MFTTLLRAPDTLLSQATVLSTCKTEARSGVCLTVKPGWTSGVPDQGFTHLFIVFGLFPLATVQNTCIRNKLTKTKQAEIDKNVNIREPLYIPGTKNSLEHTPLPK